MIPLSAPSLKQLNAFPSRLKIIAHSVVDSEVRDKVAITADTMLMAAMLTLIEDFGFGKRTCENARLMRFVAGVQERVDTAVDLYTDAAAIGLRNKLHRCGVEYDLKR